MYLKQESAVLIKINKKYVPTYVRKGKKDAHKKCLTWVQVDTIPSVTHLLDCPEPGCPELLSGVKVRLPSHILDP